MKQSRRASFIESWANIIVGLTIQYAAAMAFFWAYDIPVSWSLNTKLALFMTVISLVRSFVLRRVFEHLRVTGVLR